MRRISILLSVVAFLLLAGIVIGQEIPDWARRDYPGSVDQVFAAALTSIQEQHHEVKSKDDMRHSVDFNVGTTAWSWGYNMTLTATLIENTQVRVLSWESPAGGEAVSWGSGKKEVQEILAGIDAVLATQKAGSNRISRCLWRAMKGTSLSWIFLLCACLCCCVGVTPMRRRTVAQQGPTSNIDLTFLKAGRTTRAEVQEQLKLTNVGLEDGRVFVGRWRTSRWGGWIAFGTPAGYGGVGGGRLWNNANLLVQFDGNGTVENYEVFPDKLLIAKLFHSCAAGSRCKSKRGVRNTSSLPLIWKPSIRTSRPHRPTNSSLGH
jgi:hypothetical protein